MVTSVYRSRVFASVWSKEVVKSRMVSRKKARRGRDVEKRVVVRRSDLENDVFQHQVVYAR